MENILVYSSKNVSVLNKLICKFGCKKIKKSTQATNLTGVNYSIKYLIMSSFFQKKLALVTSRGTGIKNFFFGGGVKSCLQ